MAFDYTSFRTELENDIFKEFGFIVTLKKADETTAKALAVWDMSKKRDDSSTTTNKKQLYIAGSIKKAPVPGDYIQQGADIWHIEEVEAYKPATVVLAYRVIVQ